jgi:hypothetical protein
MRPKLRFDIGHAARFGLTTDVANAGQLLEVGPSSASGVVEADDIFARGPWVVASDFSANGHQRSTIKGS